MKNIRLVKYLLLIIVLVVLGNSDALLAQEEPDPPFLSSRVPPVEKGDRTLGIMPWSAVEGSSEEDFGLMTSAGVDCVTLGFGWKEIELDNGLFDWTEYDSHNQIYQGISVILMINPIEIDWRSVPADLQDVPFDDPEMILRLNSFLTRLFERTSMDIAVILFGNETPHYLADTDEWSDYKVFYETAMAHVKILRPGILVGTEASHETAIRFYTDEVKDLNENSDIFATTYYPHDPGGGWSPTLEFLEDDLDLFVAEFGDKPIYIMEIGYTSSSMLKSSEEEQAFFIREVFKAWDKHADVIKFLQFFALHDYTEDYIRELFADADFANLPDWPLVVEGFTTLGLRYCDGKGRDKKAFDSLKDEAAIRGWIE